jgi:hypothetical protein
MVVGFESVRTNQIAMQWVSGVFWPSALEVYHEKDHLVLLGNF